MNEVAIKCKNLNLKLGKFAIKDINMELHKGYVTGLIGRNGAGKTSLINMLAGVIEPDNGAIYYDDLIWWENGEKIRQKISVVYDKPNFGQGGTPKRLAKRIMSIEKDFDKEFYFKKLSEMELDEKMSFKRFSEGMLKKFMLVLAISRKPEILILDEPTSNVDPISRIHMIDMLQEFMEEENHTILFSTHITNDLDKIADYIIILEKGEIILSDEKEKIKELHISEGIQPSIEDIMFKVVDERRIQNEQNV